MTTQPDDWERWRAAWTQPPVGDLDVAASRAGSALRRMRLLAVAESLIVVAVVGVVSAAVRHAANPLEMLLAVAAAAISIVMLARQVATRRRESRLLATSLADYPALLIALKRREVDVSRLTMLAVGALLVFLLLWWLGGLSYHRGQAFAPLTVGLFWVPLLGSLGLLTWSFRTRRRARDLLDQLSRADTGDTGEQT